MKLDRLARRRQIGFRFATLATLAARVQVVNSGRRNVVISVDATFLQNRDVHGREFGRSEPFETARIDCFVEGERAVRIAGVAGRDERSEVCGNPRGERESTSLLTSRT